MALISERIGREQGLFPINGKPVAGASGLRRQCPVGNVKRQSAIGDSHAGRNRRVPFSCCSDRFDNLCPLRR